VSDEVTIDALKGTVSYARKVSDGNYGTVECSVFMQADIAPGADADAIDVALKAAAFTAKAHVLEQLGLAVRVDELGVIRELERVLDAKVVETKTSGAAPKPAARKAQADDKEAMWAELHNEYQSSGTSTGNTKSYWDNREGKRNPKAPDFKHKQTGEGLWLNQAPEWFGSDEPF
jgi:hypothetical protein